MQIISTINSFVQLQGTSYYKKNNFTFCPGKSRENSINIFQDLQTKFKDFPGQQKKSRTFPGCGNPANVLIDFMVGKENVTSSANST